LGDDVLLETHDGGKSWTNVTGKLPIFPHILDINHWWGIESNPIVGALDGRTWTRTLARTADGGHTWTKSPLPYEAGDFPLIRFLAADVGWIGSIVGSQLAVFRTADGGKSWDKSSIATPRTPVQLVALSFLDRTRGWVITNFNLREGFNGTGSYVFATTDG